MQDVRHRPPRPRGIQKRTTALPRSHWVRWLGQLDQRVEYSEPGQRPEWLAASVSTAWPVSIMVGELRDRPHAPDMRTREGTLLTTLLDPARYPAGELAPLHCDRWLGEVFAAFRMVPFHPSAKKPLHLPVFD